jgi:hypothetical protein
VFPFLRLLAELRNRVYKLSLVSEEELSVTHKLKKKPRRRVAVQYYENEDSPKTRKVNLNLNLLLVTKQIQQEATGILYRQDIKFMCLDALFYFLSQIGRSNIETLRSITINRMAMGRQAQLTHPAFTALLNATNLEFLDVCSIELRYSEQEYVSCDHGTKDIAASFFFVAHVWIEQMERYRSDSKSWEDVLVLAQGSTYKNDRCWSGEMFEFQDGKQIFSREEFLAEIYELLKE